MSFAFYNDYDVCHLKLGSEPEMIVEGAAIEVQGGFVCQACVSRTFPSNETKAVGCPLAGLLMALLASR